MKSSSFFWGMFLLSLGLFGVLFNFDIDFPGFKTAIKFWPVILIVWGITLFKVPKFVKFIFNGLLAILLSYIIIAGISGTTNLLTDIKTIKYTTDKIEDKERVEFSIKDTVNTEHSFFSFDGGAGEFRVEETDDEIVKVLATNQEAELISNAEEGVRRVFLESNVTDLKIGENGVSNKADIFLNENTIWDLDFDTGASSFKMDLEDLKVRTLKLETGVSNINIRLGDLYEKTELDIECGVSNVVIKIPEEALCRIYVDADISDINLDEFEEIGNNEFLSLNGEEETTSEIIINIKSGISNFEFIRY